MKILFANKFYYKCGGDCIVTLGLEELLKSKGHEVAIFAMDYPENIDSSWRKYWPSNMTKVKACTRPFGDSEVKRLFAMLLDDFNPDVVHLQNIHTQLSPVIAEIAHDRGIKVFWTLHDCKLICPCYTCQRDGKWCEECFTNPKAVIRHRCVPGNLPGAVIGYLEKKKWNIERLCACTSLFLPPSKFMADICIRGGYPKDKFKVLSNFIDTNKIQDPSFEKGDYYCYVGRIVSYKGIKTLCEAASKLPYRLVVIGGGDLLPDLKSKYPNIDFLGQKDWADFRPILEGAKFMVLPSECSENNPLTVIESQSLGTPVLGACIGGIPELIEEGVSGMTFISGDIDDLKNKIQKIWNFHFDYERIAKSAVDLYSSESYYTKLMDIYNSVPNHICK